MKDSGIEWIGDIPEEWEVVKVKDAFIRKNLKASQENPVVLSLARSGIKIRDISNNEGQLAADYTNYNPVDIDDLLLNPMDLISGDNCNISKVVGVISPAYYNLRYKKGTDPEFYNLYFKNLYWRNVFFAHGKGVSYENRWTLNYETLSQMKIPFPLIYEQNKISKYLIKKLDKIENIKEIINNEIENLENYKKSVITEAVTKGLDKNVEMKDSGIEWIGEIPKHWEIIRLKYGLTEKMKYGASEEGVEFSETLPRYIRITDIDQNGNLKSTGKQSLPENKSVGYILEDNTVLFARSGATVGKTFLYKKEYGRSAYAGYLIAAKTNNIILLGVWLYYFTFSDAYYNWTRQMFSQSTIQNINAEKYSNMPLPITNISNQLKIIDYLNKKTKIIDDSIAIKQKQLETLEEYKKSLIYEYVTGKKEVKDGEET